MNNWAWKDWNNILRVEIIDKIDKNLPVSLKKIHIIGGKLSGKTTTGEYIINYLTAKYDRFKVSAEIIVPIPSDRVGMLGDFSNKMWKYGYNKDFKALNNTTKGVYIQSCKGTDIPIRSLLKGTKTNNTIKADEHDAGTNEVSGKYHIILADEMYRADERLLNDKIANTRGYEYLIVIYCSNPWSKSNQYIRYCSNFLKYDYELLQTQGYQQYRFLNKRYGLEEDTLIIYNNWRVNKENLAPESIYAIMNYYNTSKAMGLCADLGVAGMLTIGVYRDRLNNGKINKFPAWEKCWAIGGGADFSTGNSKGSGLTTFYFCMNTTTKLKVMDELVFDFKKQEQDFELMYFKVCNFYNLHRQKYILNTHDDCVGLDFNIYCDFSSEHAINGLNRKAEELGFSWLHFWDCIKSPVKTRVEYTWDLADNGCLEISENCTTLLEEMENIDFEDVEILKRVKKADHGINGFEYWLEHWYSEYENMIENKKNLLKVVSKNNKWL